MRRFALLLAACSSAPAPVENQTTIKTPPPVASLPGPRAAIVHSKFLYKPISVVNPTQQPIMVSTATQSIMLLTIPLADNVGIMLTSDGKTGGPLGPLEPGDVLVDRGSDATLQWVITKKGAGLDMSAVNLPTGVYCMPYHDYDKPELPLTRAQVDQLLATCRDIRFATPAELADTKNVFSD